jgi:hypothetical protein
VDPVKGVEGGVFCREHKARESVDMAHRYVCVCVCARMYVCDVCMCVCDVCVCVCVCVVSRGDMWIQ